MGANIDWSQLRHCYGPATDIPGLLAKAATAAAPRSFSDEPWYSLWSALRHQSDVYTASYAAVPELVAIASRRRKELAAAAELLFLAGIIELERHRPESPPVPEFLHAAYAEARQLGAALTAEFLSHGGESDSTCLHFVISQHCFEGRLPEARLLVDGARDDSYDDDGLGVR